MAITAALVKELRERTGVGMMDCKKALTEANGDIELAIENMRKSGQAKAAKKAGRVTAEGLIGIKTEGNSASMVEVNCETDFTARNDEFIGLVNDVLDTVFSTKETNLSKHEALGKLREEKVQSIGENMTLRRALVVDVNDGEAVGAYLHGGKIGAIVTLKGGDADLAKEVAMHVAAVKPQFVSGDHVSADVIAKEKEIYSAQAAESGKPADIVEKMVDGRIKKFIKEISLLEQPFVKDPDQTVGQLLKAGNAEALNFYLYELGEGIEKEETDFAAEVAAQMKG